MTMTQFSISSNIQPCLPKRHITSLPLPNNIKTIVMFSSRLDSKLLTGDQDEDLGARQSRWGNLISTLEDEWDTDSDDDDDDDDRNLTAPGLSSSSRGVPTIGATGLPLGDRVTPPVFDRSTGSTASTTFGFNNFGTSFSSPSNTNVGLQWGEDNDYPGSMPSLSTKGNTPTLQEWIMSHRGNDNKAMDISDHRKYLEKSVRILHSLCEKIVGGYKPNNVNSMSDGEEIYIHPNFITIENVTVQVSSTASSHSGGTGPQLDAQFVKCGDSIFCNDSEDEARKKYIAMDALGKLSYELFMMMRGPSVLKFCSKGIISNAPAGSNLSSALNIGEGVAAAGEDGMDEEDEIINMLRKNPRTVTSEESMDSDGIISAMQTAHVPFPLCRFVSDLLDGEDVMLGRSEHAFSSFTDVLSDLKQMVDSPDSFLHASSPDRWKLVFGEKLYGRDDDMRTFIDSAERVATMRDDPMFAALRELTGKRREVVMVSGHSGAGKSRLVRLGGSSLEKKGWRFLRCKFDRVVHPEPLSILAYAFDEHLGLYVTCPRHGMKGIDNDPSHIAISECTCPGSSQEVKQRLEQIICPEGLEILAKHIPSLNLLLDIPPQTGNIELNEAMVHTLFGLLLQALSTKKHPVLFFVDDMQWADALSLKLMTSLVKGMRPDLLNLASEIDGRIKSPANLKEETNLMFCGSYRDNEVDDNHILSKVLQAFQADSSINLTEISLTGFTLDTLNEMLSGSLSLPVRRVRSLSQLVIHKTDGHPLHVIQFIQALTMDNLLTHSFDRGWEFDADSIDICPITDSVAELFSFKLRRLPKDILLGLQIISCFGSQVDRHLLGLVADYDGDSSVDINAAIEVALSEGMIERAAQLISFSHDMIQQSTIDSIKEDDLVPLLRKLVTALIKNSSASREQDSVLFVIVDLINRMGHDATTSSEESAMFAELNLRAASKAIAVPDFAGAARYSECGITFLGSNYWESQYDLSLRLHETAVLSHFSNLRDRDQLIKRINAVFDNAKDFSDKFTTQCVWIKLLAMTDIPKAIEESLNALERLGEPLDLEGVDFQTTCAELARRREQFFGEKKKHFLSSERSSNPNKVRAIKIMSSLMLYYHQSKQKTFLGAYVPSCIIGISQNFGHCEESVFGVAAFASALVSTLEDIDEGSSWARTALSLMKMYNENILIPSVYAPVYGTVLMFKEPLQSTLEPLAKGIRLSFQTGNVEMAMVNTIYYTARSFCSGKNVRVLKKEVEALTSQCRNNFRNDTSSDAPVFAPLLQFFLAPIYNTLNDFEGDQETCEEDEKDVSFPWDKVQLVNNDDIMKVALSMEKGSCFHGILIYQTMRAFSFRDMNAALKYTNMYVEHFLAIENRLKYNEIFNIFYEALITFHFCRLTGEESYIARGKKALSKMKEWLKHSKWNFENKTLLMEAELHYSEKNYDKAAMCYEASIKAAKDHRFVQEEGIANELAGIFFLERGLRPQSQKFFARSMECYKKYGAKALVTRVKTFIEKEFGCNLMETFPNDEPSVVAEAAEETISKKRHLTD